MLERMFSSAIGSLMHISSIYYLDAEILWALEEDGGPALQKDDPNA